MILFLSFASWGPPTPSRCGRIFACPIRHFYKLIFPAFTSQLRWFLARPSRPPRAPARSGRGIRRSPCPGSWTEASRCPTPPCRTGWKWHNSIYLIRFSYMVMGRLNSVLRWIVNGYNSNLTIFLGYISIFRYYTPYPSEFWIWATPRESLVALGPRYNSWELLRIRQSSKSEKPSFINLVMGLKAN